MKFWEGIKSAAAAIKAKIKKLAKTLLGPFSFDIAVNDNWAKNSGADLVKHFNSGVQTATATLSGGRTSPVAALAGGGNTSNNTTNRSQSTTIQAINIYGGTTQNNRQIVDDVIKEIARKEGRR